MTFNINAQVRLLPPTNAAQIAAQLRQQLGGVNANVNINLSSQAQRNLRNANKTLGNTSKAAKNAAGGMTDFGKQAALAGKRFFAFTIATTAVIRFVGALKQGTEDAIAFQRELIKISQVTGTSTKTLSSLTKEITRLSTTLGVSSAQLLKASRVLAQTGLTAQQTETALQALAKSDLAPTFDDIIKTTEGSIAIFRQFGVAADELEGKLGSINAVSGKFAVESGDIIAAVRRTGGAFAAAGGSLEELIALFTSVRSTTRESAESIATGFRTIFTRLQRVRTQNFLENLGIDLKNIEGQFVGPLEAVRRLSIALKNLPGTDPRFAQIIEELGGFRQVSKVIPLIQQFETAERALGVAVSGTNSLQQDAETAQQALAIQIQKTREEFAAMIRAFTETAGFKTIINLTLRAAEALTTMAEALVPLMPLLTVLGGVTIGRVLPKLRSGFREAGGFGFTGLLGRHDGGEVPLHFKEGGFVPGHGNRDTVPARLTPGEYVIRKSTVENLGKDTVSNLDKLAIGGQFRQSSFQNQSLLNVPHYALGGSIVEEGGTYASTFKPQLTTRGRAPGNVGTSKAILSANVGALAPRSTAKSIGMKKDKVLLAKLEHRINTIQVDRNKRFSKKFSLMAAGGLYESLPHLRTGSQFQNPEPEAARTLKPAPQYSKTSLSKTGQQQFGVVYSVSKAGLSSRGGGKGRGQQPEISSRNMDEALERANKGFKSKYHVVLDKNTASSSNVKFDVARGFITDKAQQYVEKGGRKGYDQLMRRMSKFLIPDAQIKKDNEVPGWATVSGFMFEGIVNRLGSPFTSDTADVGKKSDDRRTWDFPQGIHGNSAKLFNDSRLTGIPVDAKRADTRDAKASIKKKIENTIATKIYPSGKFEGFEVVQGKRPAPVKKALGGNVDSVNAVLTPGEYVVSKDAASTIGTTKLDYINKTGKLPGFNKGGAFGRVNTSVMPRFAGGGTVRGGGVGITQIGFAVAGISALINSIGGLSDSIKKVANFITGVTAQFALLYTGIKTTIGFFGKFDQNIDQATKNLEGTKEAGRKQIRGRERSKARLAGINQEIAQERQAQQAARRAGAPVTVRTSTALSNAQKDRAKTFLMLENKD